jgi:hypothetical protein
MCSSERNALRHGRLAQVSEAEIDAARHAGGLGGRPGDSEHPRRGIDSDDVDSRLRDGYRNAPGSDGEFDDGATRRERLVDVEADVFGDRAAPRVVERRDLVVEALHGFLAIHTNSRLVSSNGRRSNQP